MIRHLATAVVLLGTNLNAMTLDKWGTSGAWEILVDPTAGNGCLAQRDLDGGTRVQIGVVPIREGGFFAAYNSDWTHIEDGAVGVLKFDFGDERFAGEVISKFSDNMPGGYAFFDNPVFVSEFARRYSVKIWGESDNVVDIDLAGSKNAISAVLECQEEQPEPLPEPEPDQSDG